ncbi:MAG: hypothetical protein KC621_18620 [Myxococcales bacterium]|nr:hypothetical protein [Myxococcales bacterium]
MLWCIAPAGAVTTEELSARLAEVEETRQLRVWASAPHPSETELRKIAGGAVVTTLVGASGGGTSAYAGAIVPMDIGHFWAALNDETRHPGYTAVSYSELLSGRICQSGRRVLQFLPVPMLADRWWIGVLTKNSKIMTASGGSVRELSWTSSIDPAEIGSTSGQSIIAKGEPIGFTKGSWFLVALDQRSTYLEYYIKSDPGGSIPSSMASMFVTKGVRETILAIQKFASEATPSCPIE